MLCVTVTVLAGCSTPAVPDQVVDDGTTSAPAIDRVVTLPGPIGDRTAAIYHPPSARPGAPLVIILHGSDGSGSEIRKTLGWDQLADREGFVVAYPDALQGRWNAGGCCREAAMPAIDDVAFLHDLQAKLVADDQLDPHRTYSVGLSNGGMLSYAWACSRPGDLAAIGVVAATLAVSCPDPAPLTVVAVHGTGDSVVPLNGGLAGRRQILSLDESLAPFLASAGCPAQPTTDTTGRVAVSTWACTAGHSVVRDVITGAKHGWPDPPLKAVVAPGDPRDTTGFMWSELKSAQTG